MIKIRDIVAYNQGYFRYFLYYSKELIKINLSFLIRKFIKEQLEYRMLVMNRECYDQGSCITCGCKVPALQMSNKKCGGDCYPQMLTKKQWNLYKETMENWREKSINLGNILVDKQQTIIFQAQKELDIDNISTSCGCSKANYDKNTRKLTVTFNPGSIPYHLKSQGYYVTTKKITVYYKDRSMETLSFKAKVNQTL